MKLNAAFFFSSVGQLVIVGGLVLIGGALFAWQQQGKAAAKPVAPAAHPTPRTLPSVFTREPMRIKPAAEPAPKLPEIRPKAVPTLPSVQPLIPEMKRPSCPLLLAAVPATAPVPVAKVTAPYGRMIPCETVVALESNRLETPVVGLVTEDVWHEGVRIIPAGAEVHGKAALDRTRERIAVEGSWHIVWRTDTAENGRELTVSGLALDREKTGNVFGPLDGSAGLRGVVVKTADERELRLFASTFVGSAAAALQDTQESTGLLGAVAVPAATVRNGTLAGLAAIAREYATSLREAIAKDGFYVRVPAGKPFYLYVTQPIPAAPPL